MEQQDEFSKLNGVKNIIFHPQDSEFRHYVTGTFYKNPIFSDFQITQMITSALTVFQEYSLIKPNQKCDGKPGKPSSNCDCLDTDILPKQDFIWYVQSSILTYETVWFNNNITKNYNSN